MSSKTKPHYSAAQAAVDILMFLLFSIVQITLAIVKSLVPRSWKNKKNIEGEVAVVTGAGSGIGRLTALRLARLKARVVVWDINEAGVKETVKLIKANGGDAKGYVCDLCKKEDVYHVAKKTAEEVGEVSILINNAGMVSGKPLMETPDHLIERTFGVNILAHFWTTKSFLPSMMKNNKGHIVTIASMAGHVGTPKLIDYSSSKHAAVGFDEALKLELESEGFTGIHTSCICPYFIQSTGMFDNVHARFLPTLNSNQVADTIIDAILYNKRHVVIPAYLSGTVLLKQLVPWSVYSTILRNLVPDAVPDAGPVQPVANVKATPAASTGKLDSADMRLNHRVPITAERQP